MASVLFGGGVSLVVGKHGGSAFQRRRGGNIMRPNVTPVLAKTNLTSFSRTQLSFLSHYWSNNFNATQIATWNTYASGQAVMNRVGQVTTLSGQQTFFKLNMNLLSAGAPIITSPPVTGAVGSVTTLTIVPKVAGGGTIQVNIIAASPTPNDVGIIRLTPSISQGRSYVNTQLRSMLLQVPLAVLTHVETQWIQFFGSPPSATGLKLIGRAHVLNTATGIVSAEFQSSASWI